MTTRTADAGDLARAVALFLCDAGPTELRVLETRRGTVSGYFTDRDKLIAAARAEDGKGGVYLVLNPAVPEALARAANVCLPYAKHTTGDREIATRRLALIDLDPVRLSGIPSTDAEHEMALALARVVYAWLIEQGVPSASLVATDSGNGAAILVRVELPNDDASTELVKRFLAAVDRRFSTDTVKVDRGVFNAARLTRLPGTVNCKGSGTAERPHRRARLLHVPDTIATCPTEIIEAIAAPARVDRGHVVDAGNGSTGSPLNLPRWLADHGLAVSRVKPWNGGTLYLLAACPFDASHGANGEVHVGQYAGGAVDFACMHSSCTGKTWRDVRDLLEPSSRERRESYEHRADPDRTAPPDAADGDDETTAEPGTVSAVAPHCTDLGNAQRLVRAHGKNLRFCKSRGGWFVWDGRRWKRDASGEVMRLAKRIVLALYREGARITNKEEREAFLAHAKKSEAEPRLRAMVALAETEATVARDGEGWDADPWALNVLNGTLDLRTGTLRDHRRDDHLTKLAPVVYDPKATHPVWDKFLRDATGGFESDGNAEMIAFLQRFFGYTLTGDTSEEKLALILGAEASGKSTFIIATTKTLGDYAQTTDFETFLKRPATGGPRNDLARLAGARLVASIEVEDGKALAEGVVKAMTGGDTVTARLLYQEHFEFVPTFTLWLAANHAPRVRADDGAMWRRILRIPFDHTIAKDKRDANVKRTLRNPKLAGPAILAWAVQGCLDWQRDGLGVPQSVTEATDAYREDMDPLRDFIAERCVVAPNVWASFDDLWASYQDWAKHDRWALGRRTFGERLTGKGWLAKHTKTGQIRRGIALIAAEVTLGDVSEVNSLDARACRSLVSKRHLTSPGTHAGLFDDDTEVLE